MVFCGDENPAPDFRQEDLGEALLNFATLADLSGWLERLPKSEQADTSS